MAEITRPGPLAGVRPIDFATVVMGPYAALIFGDLGADVMPLGELSEDPQVREQLIEAVEKTYGSYSRPTQPGTRRKQLAVQTALPGVNRHNNNENKGITHD